MIGTTSLGVSLIPWTSKNAPGMITDSVFPSRSTVRPRRLPRIESPTSSAPTITAVAVATPNATANETRQECRTPALIICENVRPAGRFERTGLGGADAESDAFSFTAGFVQIRRSMFLSNNRKVDSNTSTLWALPSRENSTWHRLRLDRAYRLEFPASSYRLLPRVELGPLPDEVLAKQT